MRGSRCLGIFLLALGWSSPAGAQEGDSIVRIELRVSSSGPAGVAVVDRGERDGLQPGDRVQLLPREGGPWPATVVEVTGRSAVIELADRSVLPAPGTRGEVLVPRERLDALLPATPPVGESAPEGVGDPAQGQAWENPDEGWTPSMPLLAQVGAVRPQERDTRVVGRMYFAGEQILASDDRSDTYLRLGTGLTIENAFGRGGALNLDGELLYRATQVPDDQDDGGGPDARLDRASYAWGGTRFDATRWEVGRFLQSGLSEFGILDGVEWRQRRKGGDSWGVSFGYMPDVSQDLTTGDDLQLAASYQWLVDDAGRLRLEGGFQKTMHEGDFDRDLLVAKVLYLPARGWDLQGTAWIDFYGSEDEAKDAFVEVTQAWLSTRRSWDDGGRLDFSYRHLAFPELLRQEFEPVTFDQLASDRYDRLAARGVLPASKSTRLRGTAGAWLDEDDAGGDAEVGIELDDVLLERGRLDLSLFGTAGRFAWLGGVRAALGQSGPVGSWQVFYEFTANHQDGFSSDLDDIYQHRFGGLQSLASIDGWSVSAQATGTVWGDDAGLQLGLYIQRSF